MTVLPARPSIIHSSLLGIAQIIAWGGSFYLTAVLAAAVVRDTGWAQSWVYGSLSVGILISGLLAPAVGKLITRFGGRPMLLASSPILAIGLLLLAIAPNLPCFVGAWLIIGTGMAAGLYDPLFATLGQRYGKNARGAITQVTLVSGFCTSITWPLVALLVEHLGWRGACLAYSAMLVLLVLPIYLVTLPPQAIKAPTTEAAGVPTEEQHLPAPQGRVYWLMTASFILAAVIMTAISVQLISLLQARGATLVTALAIAALIGPSQVGARVVEVLFARKAHPIWSMLGSTAMVAIGLIMIMAEPGLAVLGMILYGTGSGIRSIVRGTLPLALFGAKVYPLVLGRVARPTLIGQALTPIVGGLIQQHFGATVTFAVLVALALSNIVLVALLRREVAR
ncbi:MAG: MFS transporter [Janthinobacterium lividum]